MRLQILHQRHDHDHEHARTVSLHPFLYFLSPTHHASRITRVPPRGKHNVRRVAARAPPPPGVSCAHNRVSHAHDAGVTPRSRSSLTPAPGRARRAASPPRARSDHLHRVETRPRVPYRRPCVRIDSSSSSSVVVGRRRRSVASVDARGFRPRLSRATSRSRDGRRGDGGEGYRALERVRGRRTNRTHTRVAHCRRAIRATTGHRRCRCRCRCRCARSVGRVSFFVSRDRCVYSVHTTRTPR